jgi:phosphohistidine swiveling domain-containing protein
MDAVIVPLAGLRGSMLAEAGGKAANLGELVRAGLPVPPGFCVTTAGYREVARDAAVQAAIAAVAATPVTDAAGLQATAERVRAALLAAPVPEALVRACEAAYAGLADGEAVVAVRSSATAEDLPDASFAGQQDTLLGVRGAAAVMAAIRKCWASLFTDRAVAYRAPRGIDPRGVELAVVVQALVPASVAGVLFTANPLTGQRRAAVIDASPGLGEAVVSGAVNPDHFELDVRGAVVRRRIGDKRVRIDADAEGGTRRAAVAASDEACVSEAELRALVELGREIEAHFGAPQDVEWALDEERRPWILQARPITTLYPIPADAPTSDEPLAVYLNFNVAQGVLRPLTPMGLHGFRVMMGRVVSRVGFECPPLVGPAFVHAAGHRLLVDIGAALRHPVGRRVVLAVFSRMEARSAAVVRWLVEEDPRLAVRPASRLALIGAALRGAWRTRAPVNVVRGWIDPAAARERVWAAAGQALAFGETGGDVRPESLYAAAERLLLRGMPVVFLTAMPTMVAGMLALQAARRLLRGIAAPEEIEVTLRALPHNPTTIMDLELWAVSRAVAEDPAAVAEVRGADQDALARRFAAGTLPAALQTALAGFLGRYGARGVAEIDIGVARWGEDPRHVLGAICNYLAQADPERAPDLQFARAGAAAEAMVETLVARARASGRVRGRLVRLAFSRVRALVGMREAPKFCLVQVFARVRALLLGIGEQLAARGVFARADDVFMLTLPEVKSALAGVDVGELVRGRRVSFGRELARRHLPRVLLSDGTDAEAALAATRPAGGGICGTPASAGRVTGPARVILDPVGARIEPGEILVAPSTDPGWTPLFLTAGGLVMEMGGAMSHGAVVAREYGIPAVVGVALATGRIVSGQIVTVDGNAGTVTIEPAV